MNDVKEEGNLRYGLYKQPLVEGSLGWRIEGLYKKDDFKIKNVIKLKKDPPVLILEDDKNNKVEFVLTENVSRDLEESLRVLNNGYRGIQNRRKMKIKDIKNIKKNWKEWPVDTVLIAIFLLVLIGFFIVDFIR